METFTEVPTQRRHVNAAIARTGARILVADDDPEMRRMVAGSLREDGYDVVDVADGGAILMRLATGYAAGRANGGFSLLLCDVRMPVYSGLNVLEGLRRARWSIPAILMSAFGDAELHGRVASARGILFDKPFDIDDLRTAVAHVLRSGPTGEEGLAEDPLLELVASRANSLDAWTLKWALQAEGIQVFLGGRAMSTLATTTDLYVLRGDVVRARALIELPGCGREPG